jgi:uncharacterized protein
VFACVPVPGSHVVRDPAHGLLELSRAERTAVDTPVLQRLRRVLQPGDGPTSSIPGALHTRFEHSIG